MPRATFSVVVVSFDVEGDDLAGDVDDAGLAGDGEAFGDGGQVLDLDVGADAALVGFQAVGRPGGRGP